MRNITEEARLVMNTRRNFVNYARVTLHDGTVLNLTPSDFRISGNTITDDWNEGEAFQLGSVIGKTATLLLDNTDGRTEVIEGETVVYPHGKFSEYDFYMSYFELYIHLPNSTHYQGELIDTVIPIGTFTVTTPASHGATIEITGVDNMYMFDKSFNDCTLNFDYHPTLLTILNRCCQDCGVAIGYTGFTNETITVTKKPKDVTYRQVVSYIAQIAGCNAVIGTTGALQLKWYDMTPVTTVFDGGRFLPWDGKDNTRDTLDGGSFNPWTEGNIADGGDFTTPLGYHNLTATNGTSISTDDIQFTGVMVSYEVVNEDGNTETQALHYPDVSNWNTYAMKIEQNPFIESQIIAIIVANTIWSAIGSLKFRVFSCQSIQDPTIEAGDCALVYDVKGNIYPTVITNVTFKTGGMTEVSCTAESPLKQNTRYVNPAARAVAVAEQRQDDYNVMVAHFNEIAYASTGYYKTERTEQGATITYYHDRPTLAASTNVVKVTSTGAFISTDGGQSYNAGVDTSTATMLMNLIYVKGLNADWIKAGQIDANRLTANVIASINNATGSTTINGGKINIAGVVNGINAGSTTIDGGKITTNTIDTNQIKANAITTNKIAAGSISTEKIMAGNITSEKLATSCVTAEKIASGTITANEIAVGTITTDEIAARTIKASNIATGTLTANEIAANAITTEKIAANAVTAAKISVANLQAISAKMGTVDVGGADNGNGVLRVRDASNDVKVRLNNAGITATYGKIGGFEIGNDNIGDPRNTNFAIGMLGGKDKNACLYAFHASYNCRIYHGRIDVHTGADGNKGIYVYSGSDEHNGNYIKYGFSDVYRSSDGKSVQWGSSDRRLKKNIKDLTLEEAKALVYSARPRKFRFKKEVEEKGERYGFIAQELRETLDENSGIEYTNSYDYHNVHYDDFVAPLCMIVKKQQEEIDDLKERLAKLESIVNTNV